MAIHSGLLQDLWFQVWIQIRSGKKKKKKVLKLQANFKKEESANLIYKPSAKHELCPKH